MGRNRKGSTPLYEAKHGTRHCRENKLCVECGDKLTGRKQRWCSQTCVDAYLVRADPQSARRQVEARDHGVCSCCGIDTEAEIRDHMKAADKEAFEAYLVWLNRERPQGIWVGYRVWKEKGYGELGYAREYGPWTYTGYAPGGAWSPSGGSRKRRRRKRHAAWGRSYLAEIVETKRKEKLIEIGRPEFIPWWWRKTYWDMDHVRAVERGGGECGLDNLRTLCVVCHSKRSARDATARAKGGMRRIERRPDEECEYETTCRAPDLCGPCKKFRSRARTLLASK